MPLVIPPIARGLLFIGEFLIINLIVMRQLKTFMRNRKKEMLACGPCECRTLQCWRYANENCGCGESKSSLPNYVRVEGDVISGGLIQFFNEDDEQWNAITIEIDIETGDEKVVLWDFLIIENEDARALWRWMREDLDAEAVAKLFGIDEGKTWIWGFTPEAMAQFNAFVNNPTEEQAQILKDWLEDSVSDEYDPPRHPIVIFDE